MQNEIYEQFTVFLYTKINIEIDILLDAADGSSVIMIMLKWRVVPILQSYLEFILKRSYILQEIMKPGCWHNIRTERFDFHWWLVRFLASIFSDQFAVYGLCLQTAHACRENFVSAEGRFLNGELRSML